MNEYKLDDIQYMITDSDDMMWCFADTNKELQSRLINMKRCGIEVGGAYKGRLVQVTQHHPHAKGGEYFIISDDGVLYAIYDTFDEAISHVEDGWNVYVFVVEKDGDVNE